MFTQLIFDDDITYILGNILYIGLMIYYSRKLLSKDNIIDVKRNINQYTFRTVIISAVGCFVDLMIYAESIGGIYGGTGYTFAIAINTIISYAFTLMVFSLIERIMKKKLPKENEQSHQINKDYEN